MDFQRGMIFGYILDGKGGGNAIDWERLKHWTPDQGLLWVHLDYSSEDVKHWLRTESNLSEISSEILIAEDTRPRIVSSTDGLILILRGVNFNPGSDPEDMVALRMCFADNRIITMRHRKVMAIEDIHKAIISGNGPTAPGDFLVNVSNRISDRIGDVISEIDDRVDELEDSVVTEKSYRLRTLLSDLRRQCISLRRYIAPQRDVLARLQAERAGWLSDMDKVHLREIVERTVRYVEDIDAARDRAAITQEELNNRLSEQMNKAMYVLSIVAAIFLPLGLITGLLGINVGGIPGVESSLAFYNVSMSLLLLAILLVWLFRRVKWL